MLARETGDVAKPGTSAGYNVPHHAQSTTPGPQMNTMPLTPPVQQNALGLLGLPPSTLVDFSEERPSPAVSETQHPYIREAGRGQKLGFLRKQFSTSRSSPKRPSVQCISSNGSLPSSRTTSLERAESSLSCPSKCRILTHFALRLRLSHSSQEVFKDDHFPGACKPHAIDCTNRPIPSTILLPLPYVS
jgi:hypothetical protein